jgi:hypothetical protein
MAERWPWPGDSREDRAKRVALSYRDVLHHIARGHLDEYGLPYDPAGELHRLDQHWADLGIYWHLPRPAMLIDPDEWMGAPDLAFHIDRTPRDIYNWARRGHIVQRVGPDGAPEYSVASVIAYQRKQRARRRRNAPSETM